MENATGVKVVRNSQGGAAAGSATPPVLEPLKIFGLLFLYWVDSQRDFEAHRFDEFEPFIIARRSFRPWEQLM